MAKEAGLDSRVQKRRSRCFGLRRRSEVGRVAGASERVPEKLLCGAKNMRFRNGEEANKYLTPTVRKGWKVNV
jgi:hypothetical protein